jgi:tRNA G18 (ribose-2'-O)-methylase SpoU
MPTHLVLENIRSLYNVGSMFRTADGFGVAKIWLCGYTGTPEQKGLTKVALGAEKTVPWEKVGSAWRLVEKLKREGFFVVALERTAGAVSLRDLRPPKGKSIALVLGNEVEGVSSATLKRADAVVEIPMSGVKESFNVAVSCGVALYGLGQNRPVAKIRQNR